MLIRNLILMAIPMAFILFAALITVSHMRKMDDAQVYDMDDANLAEEYYLTGKVNVLVRISGLQYSGFDYKVGDKIKGSYFYLYRGGKMNIFLLDNDMTERVKKAEEGSAFSVKFRIVKDELTTDHILSEYMETLGLNTDSKEDAVSVYVLDQLRFPKMWIVMLDVFYYILQGAIAILLLYLIVAFYRPQILKQARVLKRFGKVKSVVADLDYEMRNELLYQSDNIFVTESYLIVAYVSRIDVVYLDDVEYMSKHEETKRGGRMKTYRLTLSNVEKMYFEMFIDDEQTIDEVAYYIQGGDENEQDKSQAARERVYVDGRDDGHDKYDEDDEDSRGDVYDEDDDYADGRDEYDEDNLNMSEIDEDDYDE